MNKLEAKATFLWEWNIYCQSWSMTGLKWDKRAKIKN
jgi:hypothetical protein